MLFSLELVPRKNIGKLIEYSRIAEDLGMFAIWLTDHYRNRDPFQAGALIGLETSRIKIGIGATNPHARHPASIASSAATLYEATSGRSLLGISAGDRTTLIEMGLDWDRPIRRVRECVEIVRALLRGERVSYQGKIFRLRGARLSIGGIEIPIYIGARGPRMLELGGEIGDGVLVNASDPWYIERAVRIIEKGARRSGRSPKDLDIAAYTSTSISTDLESARKAARIVVAYIVAGLPRRILENYDLDPRIGEEIGRALISSDIERASKLVSNEMIDIFSICGTKREVRERIEELGLAGANHVVFGSPIGPSFRESLMLLGEIVREFSRK